MFRDHDDLPHCKTSWEIPDLVLGAWARLRLDLDVLVVLLGQLTPLRDMGGGGGSSLHTDGCVGGCGVGWAVQTAGQGAGGVGGVGGALAEAACTAASTSGRVVFRWTYEAYCFRASAFWTRVLAVALASPSSQLSKCSGGHCSFCVAESHASYKSRSEDLVFQLSEAERRPYTLPLLWAALVLRQWNPGFPPRIVCHADASLVRSVSSSITPLILAICIAMAVFIWYTFLLQTLPGVWPFRRSPSRPERGPAQQAEQQLPQEGTDALRSAR